LSRSPPTHKFQNSLVCTLSASGLQDSSPMFEEPLELKVDPYCLFPCCIGLEGNLILSSLIERGFKTILGCNLSSFLRVFNKFRGKFESSVTRSCWKSIFHLGK
jgi:hypothetical protein